MISADDLDPWQECIDDGVVSIVRAVGQIAKTDPAEAELQLACVIEVLTEIHSDLIVESKTVQGFPIP